MSNICFTSHANAYICNNIRYNTYQEACTANGLLSNENEAEIAFNEAIIDSTPSELRSLFVILTLQGFPTINIFNTYLENLKDFDNCRNYNDVLIDLNDRFNRENKNMSNYGLPKPLNINSELDQYRAELIVNESLLKLNELNQSQPNTAEMEIIYNHIQNELNNQNIDNDVVFFNIDAMGGSGKSTLAKKIYHYVRSQNKIVLGCAATALATQVYEDLNFDTTHGLFCVPVIEDEDEYDNINNIFCDLQKNPDRVELVKAAHCIICDEFFSNHKYIMNAILNSFNGLKGKVIILLMDRGQTAPIVPYGSRKDIVNATIMMHPIWDSFIQYTLTCNLRLLRFQGDPALLIHQQLYAKVLTQIRTNGPFSNNGPIAEFDENVDLGSKLLRYNDYAYFTDPKDVLNFLYGGDFDTIDLSNRALLCSTNERCDYWNNLIQQLNINQMLHTLLSADEFADVDDEFGALNVTFVVCDTF